MTCAISPSVYRTFLAGIVFLVLLVFINSGFCPFNPNSFTLILEFGQNSIIVPIATQLLPGSPNQYTFSSSDFIDDVTLSGILRPALVVTWPTLRIYNHHLDMHFHLPQSISLGPLQAYRLRKLLHSSYRCMLSARYGQYAYRLDIASDQEPDARAPKSFTPLPKPMSLLITSQDDGACSSTVLASDGHSDPAQF